MLTHLLKNGSSSTDFLLRKCANKLEILQFLLQEEESGGSSTDMSICRSEALFSSMRDSANMAMLPPDIRESLIADSLIDGAEDLDLTEQVKVNKNHYTLTYSRHGSIMTASIGADRAAEVQSKRIGMPMSPKIS